MDASVELRKIPIGSIYNLIHILENDQSWKVLMVNIPKDLESNVFTNKYGTDHIALIENAGLQQRRPCAQILLEEWGTSGRCRPGLGHLLALLQRAELYRAADWVAERLLNGEPVPRPSAGPAAAVDISFEKLRREVALRGEPAPSLLERSYPESFPPEPRTQERNLDAPQNDTSESVSSVLPALTVLMENEEPSTRALQDDEQPSENILQWNDSQDLAPSGEIPDFGLLRADSPKRDVDNSYESTKSY